MLVQLTVRNVALMDRVTFEPGPGFNALTGETGAGKSMIVDALTLALGGRAQPEILRTGEKEAEIEALFEPSPGSRVLARLEAAGIPCSGEIVVRRVVSLEEGRAVRSRAFINGRLSTAAQLGEIARDLCDVCSQHENVSLTDPANHLLVLDAFGDLDKERTRLGDGFERLQEIARELERVRTAERHRAEREDFLRFQLKEIEELDPRPGEEKELESERARLRHAEKLSEVTRRAASRLYDDETSLCDELARLAHDLEAAAALDGTLSPFASSIESARAELADAARALGRYAEGIESNPARLSEIDDRLFRLQKLVRRHGSDLASVRAEMEKELDMLSRGSLLISDLEEKRKASLEEVSAHARKLSRKRRQAADALADAISKELGRLGMGRARIVVDVAPAETRGEGDLTLDGARITRSGIDRVEFLIAPNKGEEPRPLRKIASGGELSRSLLAIKRVLGASDKDGPNTHVFDEVDAGVGGAVAEMIGRAIADVARHRQVICITHLPQIAALADAHFVVGKSEARGRTTSHVRKLEEDERIEEIARMIGGARVSGAARKAAEEMLKR